MNVERPIKMQLYSSKTLAVRETTVTPSNMWGGQGLLGVSIRFCSFEGANENVWHVLVSVLIGYWNIKKWHESHKITFKHKLLVWFDDFFFFWVQEVEPNSPAALASLRAHTDYIIGADTAMNEVPAYWIGSNVDLKVETCWPAVYLCFLSRVMICSPSLKPMKGKSWSCMFTTRTQTTAVRWSSHQTATGVERAGMTFIKEIYVYYVYIITALMKPFKVTLYRPFYWLNDKKIRCQVITRVITVIRISVYMCRKGFHWFLCLQLSSVFLFESSLQFGFSSFVYFQFDFLYCVKTNN